MSLAPYQSVTAIKAEGPNLEFHARQNSFKFKLCFQDSSNGNASCTATERVREPSSIGQRRHMQLEYRHLPARMFSTALATIKFLSETRPWIGFSSRLGTACLGATLRVILPTIVQKTGLARENDQAGVLWGVSPKEANYAYLSDSNLKVAPFPRLRSLFWELYRITYPLSWG